jgi:ATP-dependent DNA ligase
MAMSGSTELKLDGYCAQGIRDAEGARLLSKNGKDFSRKYPQIVQALARALTMDTVLDGELVALDDDGRFQCAAELGA